MTSRPSNVLLLLLVFSSLHPVFGQGISWIIPSDGGTPRDPKRIEQLAPREFLIRASVEEGRSFLKHAVSRVDLLCRNSNAQPLNITLRLDLSGDGQRTDYDNKPEASMPRRYFIFIQPPGKPWRQVDGSTLSWTSIVSFAVAPGDTKVGLSPWYTYADYINFISSLPRHPHLSTNMVGKSDGGRDHWELTITDPAVPSEKKKTIFWQAREHAYETFSSFAMEALVDYLLSDEAAEIRRRYVIVLHPMTNIDGVAEGYEYRGGYDFPDPRGTATGRLTFKTADRLKPDFAVAWHNWIAPQDRDVVFYTDDDRGQPTPRAWYIFTQHFRSPHATGHRWRDETTPLKYNWQGRPMGDGNIHQYAMKHYGTRIWGWEMPWWRRTVEDVRNAGPEFARGFFAALAASTAGVKLPEPEARVADVPRWTTHEFTLRSVAFRSPSPLKEERAGVRGGDAKRLPLFQTNTAFSSFRDSALVGEFISPSGKTNVVDGFYDGGNKWKLRFAPDEIGEWNYILRGEGVELFQRGRIRCTAPAGQGSNQVHSRNPSL